MPTTIVASPAVRRVYRWIAADGTTIAEHDCLADAGVHHRRKLLTLPDARCIDWTGRDLTDAAIVASCSW